MKILGFYEIVVCFELICSHLFEIPCMWPWVLWMRYRFDTVCQGKVSPRLETPSRGRCDLDQGQLQGLYQQWPELSRVLCPMVSTGFITFVWYSLSVFYNHNCLPFSELKFFLNMYIYVQVSLSYQYESMKCIWILKCNFIVKEYIVYQCRLIFDEHFLSWKVLCIYSVF